MAQVILFALINATKQRAVWQKNRAIYRCLSLYITT